MTIQRRDFDIKSFAILIKTYIKLQIMVSAQSSSPNKRKSVERMNLSDLKAQFHFDLRQLFSEADDELNQQQER